jgi:tetratricopeptide (TPR) repeat protein
MFNALEVTPLKARFHKALTAVAAGLVASLPFADAGAQNTTGPQQRGTPDPNAPRVVVAVFRGAERNAGVQAADAVRSRMQSDFTYRDLYVLPKQDVTNALEQSGFPVNEALAPHDARALAQLLRGDEYIVGQVARDSAGTRVDAQMVLARDNSLVQPLGSYRVGKPSDAAAGIVREFREAQKQFRAEQECVRNARDRKYAEAAAAARRGVAAYPKGTLARLCLANVYVQQRDQQGLDSTRVRAFNDSALAVAREVLAVDPASRPALTIQYAGLQAAGQRDQATDVLLRLVGADPTNQRLLEQVVNELAANGQAARAVPFVNRLVTDNPGDPSYLLLQMRVKLAAKDFKGGILAGRELIRSDTASATADLFSRLATAAQIDSQPQVAAQLLAQGVAKFPQNGSLLVDYADALRASGQTQQAVDLLQRASAQNPRPSGVFVAQARLYSETNRIDEALRALQQAVAAGDSSTLVARYAVQIGQTAYRAANVSKSPGDFQRAIQILEFANKTQATPEGQFLLGATALGYGQQQLQAAQSTKSCTAVNAARSAFSTAQLNLPAGGRFNPQATTQLLSALGQLSPIPDQFARALKCGGGSTSGR